jgi:hypothetical protein
LTNPALDPFGKIPEFKFCAVRAEKVEAAVGGGVGRTLATASPVIACDKRGAFAQGNEATKQSILPLAEPWIASLRLQQSRTHRTAPHFAGMTKIWPG